MSAVTCTYCLRPLHASTTTQQAVGFEGRVELEAPEHTFWVVTVASDGEAGMPAMPTRWVFGRQVALGDRWGGCAWGVGGVLLGGGGLGVASGVSTAGAQGGTGVDCGCAGLRVWVWACMSACKRQ